MVTWNNRIGHRGRSPHLWLRKAQRMYKFFGESIPDVCVVVGEDYTKEGKWSHTTYRLELAPGVKHFAFHSGWETGTIREGVGGGDTWASFASLLGVPLAEARRFLGEIAPASAAYYDKVEAELSALYELGGEDVSLQTLTFGNPTNRQIAAGWWEAPVVILDENGNVCGKIVNQNGTYVSYHDAVEVMFTKTMSGHHGGYVELTALLPSEWSLRKEDK